MNWINTSELREPLSAKCGWCNNYVEVSRVYHTKYSWDKEISGGWYIGICPRCGKPIFIEANEGMGMGGPYIQYVFHPAFGSNLSSDMVLDDPTLDSIFKQLFKCKENNIKDGFAMLLRSFLVYFCKIAKEKIPSTTNFIHKGKETKESSEMNFGECVDWIINNRLVSRDFDNYLDEFRLNGNESTHVELKGPEYDMDRQFNMLRTIIDSNPSIFFSKEKKEK